MDYLFLLSFTTVKRVFCLSVRVFTGVKGMFGFSANDFTAMKKAFGFSVRLFTGVKYLHKLTFLLFTGVNGTNIRNIFCFSVQMQCIASHLYTIGYKYLSNTAFFLSALCFIMFSNFSISAS